MGPMAKKNHGPIRDLKGPQGTSRDLKGPQGTPRDLKGPQGTTHSMVLHEDPKSGPRIEGPHSANVPNFCYFSKT